MIADLAQFPLHISFDPFQVTIFNTKPYPLMRFSYSSRNFASIVETRDLKLSADILVRLILFLERLPDTKYSGRIFFSEERITLKFLKRIQSKNPYLDVIRGTLYERFLFFDVPVRRFKLRANSCELLLTGLRQLNHAT